MKSTPRLRITVLLALIVVALASSLWAVWPWPTGDWKGLALNFGTEMAGAVVTYLLLELVIGRMERREAEREAEMKGREAKKADLIAQMGSQVQDVAVAAAEELRRHGWLYDGSLRGASLFQANLVEATLGPVDLNGAELRNADLSEAFLLEANLSVAFLDGANLNGAFLTDANLSWATLSWATLSRATLIRADLRGANLSRANLSGAYLNEANLQWAHLKEADLRHAHLDDANLQGAKFHKDTTLPDGTKWTPDTDMARFTDPEHPDFWDPDA